jgi:FkbM family methyltransferase
MQAVKRAMKRAVRALGYELMTAQRADPATTCLLHVLHDRGIDAVIDIGANEGQFARGLRRAGYNGELYSFEALTSAHAKLSAAAARDPQWHVMPRMALGNSDGTANINVAAHAEASSLLPTADVLTRLVPQAVYMSAEPVQVRRLDSLGVPSAGRQALLKIDVQGFEMNVLEGATATLEATDAILIEMSFLTLYQGQVLARDLWNWLHERSFDLWRLDPMFTVGGSYRFAQADGLFVRRVEGS